jgi:tRNA(Ile)-lysidine synthase
MKVIKNYTTFQIHRGPLEAGYAIKGTQRLTVPGETLVRNTPLKIFAQLQEHRCEGKEQTLWHADLDWDATGSELYVRGRKPGETIQPLGMDKPKKIQDLLVDEKIPRQQRDKLPIITTSSRVIWVAGVRIDDRYKVTTKTTKVLCLSVVGYN